eukprot:7188356-Prymnesium_polylepis.1
MNPPAAPPRVLRPTPAPPRLRVTAAPRASPAAMRPGQRRAHLLPRLSVQDAPAREHELAILVLARDDDKLVAAAQVEALLGLVRLHQRHLLRRHVRRRLDADVDHRAVRLKAQHRARDGVAARVRGDLDHRGRHLVVAEPRRLVHPAALGHKLEAAVARAQPLIARERARVGDGGDHRYQRAAGALRAIAHRQPVQEAGVHSRRQREQQRLGDHLSSLLSSLHEPGELQSELARGGSGPDVSGS